jgi:hypothetical protein
MTKINKKNFLFLDIDGSKTENISISPHTTIELHNSREEER